MAVKKLKPTGKKLKKKPKAEIKEVYSLPEEVSKPSSRLADYVILLYGEKKIGKTSMCQYFGKTLFLMHERGAKALSVFQSPINKWEDFQGYVKLLEKDKSFATVVIDPIDDNYKMCQRYVCKKLVIDHPADEGWGKGWDALKEEFVGWHKRLQATGKGIIYISHATEKEIKTRTGNVYHKLFPTMTNAAREFMEGVVDIWAYYHYRKEKRYLQIEGDEHVGAGHRLEKRFKYTDGSPISRINMGTSAREANERFVKAFGNLLDKPKIKPKKQGKKGRK